MTEPQEHFEMSLIERSRAKALDTRVNAARAMVSAASLLIAGLSFFVFQYFSSDQIILRAMAGVGLISLCVVVVQCVNVTYLASNIYNDGEVEGDKKYQKIKSQLNWSSLFMVLSMFVFVALVLSSFWHTSPLDQAQTDRSVGERLYYDCTVEYEGQTAKMACVRSSLEDVSELGSQPKSSP
jgi:hypothetical protein